MTDLCTICQNNPDDCELFGNEYIMEDNKVIKCRNFVMSEEEAKRIIVNDPQGDVIQRLTALAVAESVLGESCTMKDIWHWAESK